MNSGVRLKRFLEIIPGAISWGIILTLAVLAIFKPVLSAILIIIFDFYWIIRTTYLTTLLIMAHHKLFREKEKDWLGLCLRKFSGEPRWEKLYQLVIFPVCNEGAEILKPSLDALKRTHYPKEKIIVVLSFEERNSLSRDNAAKLQEEYKNSFFAYLCAFHPDGLEGEMRAKGANATCAAKAAKAFLDQKGIAYEDVIISCFDADTCVDPEYFGCLGFNFLVSEKPHQSSYQPMPVYNNNIWQSPSFARLVEISSSFSQLIESMRLEKFVTFSSHSMSFKTLVDIGYWPVDMISDDSVIYWKAFLFFNADYRVVPLYITVSMDIAYSSNIIKTMAVQYRQKRRWAWGVENFPFVVRGFIANPRISLVTKIRRSFHLLEGHVSWAVWAIIMILVGPLPLLFGGAFFNQMAIGYNLPKITGLLFNFTLVTSLIWILLSRSILPPRPKGVSWVKEIIMILEWVTVPIIISVVGSTPAIDAQTRLLLGRYLEFNPTKKERK